MERKDESTLTMVDNGKVPSPVSFALPGRASRIA